MQMRGQRTKDPLSTKVAAFPQLETSFLTAAWKTSVFDSSRSQNPLIFWEPGNTQGLCLSVTQLPYSWVFSDWLIVRVESLAFHVTVLLSKLCSFSHALDLS